MFIFKSIILYKVIIFIVIKARSDGAPEIIHRVWLETIFITLLFDLSFKKNIIINMNYLPTIYII